MDVVAYISQLFRNAVTCRASDIHIEPQEDGLQIRQRIDGFLMKVDTLPEEYASLIISRLKIMTNLDIGERRLPQDGSMILDQDGTSCDVRISTMPTLHGEKIVLRLLQRQKQIITLDHLGITTFNKEKLKKLLTRTSGLLIVTGPTGSGKTTTLYAMLQMLNRIEFNVITLEDPVEFQIRGVNQIQIHPKVGLTFSNGLRSILRQDPNIIMIGEIRDKETADIAISAALTGHLVLTTLHTRDAASAITRLFDMGVEPYRVAACLSGVIAQRLVRLICQECRGSGCLQCQRTGYYHRTGIFEIISSDFNLQEKVIGSFSLVQLRKYFREQGIRSLFQDALEKVKSNETTIDEVYRVIDYAEAKEEMEV